ncbi:MAG: YwmB family TATA-box binding protein [Clostridia bacterium]|nr:YwmB family TATA-box binding protein [Clostridia bacterium]
MKKPALITLVIFTSLLAAISLYYSGILKKTSIPESTLQNSFVNSGAKPVSSEIYFWAKLKEGQHSADVENSLIKDMMAALKVIEGQSYSRTQSENDNLRKIEVNGIVEENTEKKIINMVFQREKQQKSAVSTNISLKVTQDLAIDGLDTIRKEAMNIFKRYGIEPKVNSCITGYYDGKLEYGRMNDIGLKVFSRAQAKKVEGMRNDKMISVCAYTPEIDQYIRVNEKKINLNLAIRYNNFEDRTYIWLATPVITTEY